MIEGPIPFWLTLLFSDNWLLLVLTQLIIASIVMFAALKFIGCEDISTVWRKCIIWITLYGFLAYLLTAILFLAIHFVNQDTSFGIWLVNNIIEPLNFNPFSNFICILFVILVLAVIDLIIYGCLVKFGLRKAPIEKTQKRKLALCLVLFAGPYIALFPSYMLYPA